MQKKPLGNKNRLKHTLLEKKNKVICKIKSLSCLDTIAMRILSSEILMNDIFSFLKYFSLIWLLKPDRDSVYYIYIFLTLYLTPSPH